MWFWWLVFALFDGFGFCGSCLFWYYRCVVMMGWLAGCINSVVCLRAMACVIWFSGGFGYLSLEVVV